MKVLILAYDFPPFVSVGGLRPYSWFRHLSECGIRPVVITRQWANHYGDERDYVAPSATTVDEVEESALGTIVRAPYKPNLSNRLLLASGSGKYRLVRKSLTAVHEIGQYHATIGPKVPLYLAARRYLRDHKVDAIVATGEPFVLFRYATLLSREFGIPWIADFRDPWSQDRLRARNPVLRLWAERVERRNTASASAITTVSENVAAGLSNLHATARIEVIRNGFDPEAARAAQEIPQGGDRLTIALAGTVYAYHPIESVLQVLDQIAGARMRIGMKFIGVNKKEALERLVRERYPGIAETTTLLPRLPNEKAVAELATANVLLLFNEYAYPGTKIFDYLAVKRKILLCYSDDPTGRAMKERRFDFDRGVAGEDRVLERIVRETNSGIVVRDSAHLSVVLQALLREFDARGAIACEPIGIEVYSRRTQVAKMTQVLNSVLPVTATKRSGPSEIGVSQK